MSSYLYLWPRFVVLLAFVSSTVYIHYRGRVRHRFSRQLIDHSTLMAPYNALMYLFSAVPQMHQGVESHHVLCPQVDAGRRAAVRIDSARMIVGPPLVGASQLLPRQRARNLKKPQALVHTVAKK